MYREIMAVGSPIHKKHKISLYEQNVEIWILNWRYS